jgi:carbamoyl-phosphate synthase large subunit
MGKQFRLLISSVGRRAQLIECFRRAAIDLGIEIAVLGSDADPDLAPASRLVDGCFRVPRCSSPLFVEEMLRLCVREEIDLIIPTIDPELPLYARHRVLFEENGTKILVSGQQTVDIAFDKACSHRWLEANGFPTVAQESIGDALLHLCDWTFPVIVKPRRGSASVGVRMIHDAAALRCLAQDDRLVVESVASGIEHTTNVLVDNSGTCICAVPHRRLETRGGEVSKGLTVKNHKLMDLAKCVAEGLPDARGPLNVQGFVDNDGGILLTEINARFGGGFPLAARAGANFCRWILEDLSGSPSTARFSDWKENLLMLRFDNAVFVENQNHLI